jgi:1-acyl-sn-glycerol-3-phosphate acyltransferase
MLYFIAYLLLLPYILFGLPVKIVGKKYLKRIKKDSAIVACNHTTLNDPIILKTKLDKNLKMMAKDSLFKNKFFGSILRGLGAYPVSRGVADIKAVKTTLTHLKNKKHVLIFPEGTRVKQNEGVELKDGVVTFAIKTDSYVVPAVFRKPTKAFRFNTLVIGKPFKFSEINEFKDVKIDKELTQKATEILTEKMKYLKEVNIKEYNKKIKEDLKNIDKIND